MVSLQVPGYSNTASFAVAEFAGKAPNFSSPALYHSLVRRSDEQGIERLTIPLYPNHCILHGIWLPLLVWMDQSLLLLWAALEKECKSMYTASGCNRCMLRVMHTLRIVEFGIGLSLLMV